MSQDSENEWEIVEDEIISLHIKEELFESSEPKFKKTRVRHHHKVDYWKTAWGLLITAEDVRDVTSFNGKLFKRRFRVPFGLFEDCLVPTCRDRNIFETLSKHEFNVFQTIPQQKIIILAQFLLQLLRE